MSNNHAGIVWGYIALKRTKWLIRNTKQAKMSFRTPNFSCAKIDQGFILGDGFEGEILGGNFSIKQAWLITGALEFGIGQKGLIHEVFSNLVSIE